MIELKAHRFITTDELFHEANAGALYYDKSEADKAIAKLQDDCAYWKAMAQKNAADNAVMVKQRAEAFKKKSRHKYKRCLAMAEMCMHKRWRTDEGFDYARSHRHMNKWLAIAEKFKEAK